MSVGGVMKTSNKRPWAKYMEYMKTRCRRKKNYQRFSVTISMEELERIWFRDKAYEMDKPSVDRIDNEIGYVSNNCQFLEHRVNSAKKKRPTHCPRGHEYTPENTYINRWHGWKRRTCRECWWNQKKDPS